MGDGPTWQAATDDAWRLVTDDRQVVGELRWVQDPRDRERTGWWLRLPEDSEPRRLSIDPVTDQLARDHASPACSWLARAEAIATLTLSIALTLAESQLGRAAAGTDLAFGTGAGRYEIYLQGTDVHTVGLAFPQLAAERAGALVVVSGRLDQDELRSALRRLRALGCTIAGFVAVGP